MTEYFVDVYERNLMRNGNQFTATTERVTLDDMTIPVDINETEFRPVQNPLDLRYFQFEPIFLAEEVVRPYN